MDIKLDDLTDSKVINLVLEHLEGMALISPPESIHALGFEALGKPEITFCAMILGLIPTTVETTATSL